MPTTTQATNLYIPYCSPYTDEKVVNVEKLPTVPSAQNNVGAASSVSTLTCVGTVAIFGTVALAALVIAAVALVYGLRQSVPTGTIMMYSGTAASLVGSNSDWLFCDGSAVSRTTYRELFKVIGTRYGAGDGVNTFNLPDFRARFLMGSNTSSTTLASGGAASTTLTTGQLPSHSHTQGTLVTASSGSHTHSASDSGHTHSFTTGTSGPSNNIVTVNSGSYTNVAQSGTHTHSGTTNNGYASISVASDGSHTHTISGSTDSVGSGQSIDILPPYHTVHYVIRT